MKNKLLSVFLIIASIVSLCFLAIVEINNDITLDDIGFAVQLKDAGVLSFVKEMYLTWQGRFIALFINGFQTKSYLLFNSMLPFTIILYLVNTFLLTRALIIIFKIRNFYSVTFAVILQQVYVYTMFDISSYFWMCTKVYTFFIVLSVYALAKLFYSTKRGKFDYLILIFCFSVIGCSYEIYAPLILLLLSCIFGVQLIKNNFKTRDTLIVQERLVYSFTTCLIFFILMIIAPGNWLRMEVHAKYTDLSVLKFASVVASSSFQLFKSVFIKGHFYIAAGIIMWTILKISSFKSTKRKSNPEIIKNILIYFLICLVISVVSVILNTYAVGSRMELRAFNHINLFIFLLIGFSVFEVAHSSLFYKNFRPLSYFCLVFITLSTVYTSARSINELKKYTDSVTERAAYIQKLKSEGNTNTIFLKSLYVPRYYSADDIWKIVIPRLTPHALLKPNEVSNSTEGFYNITYKKFYNLDFDIKTNISFDL